MTLSLLTAFAPPSLLLDTRVRCPGGASVAPGSLNCSAACRSLGCGRGKRRTHPLLSNIIIERHPEYTGTPASTTRPHANPSHRHRSAADTQSSRAWLRPGAKTGGVDGGRGCVTTLCRINRGVQLHILRQSWRCCCFRGGVDSAGLGSGFPGGACASALLEFSRRVGMPEELYEPGAVFAGEGKPGTDVPEGRVRDHEEYQVHGRVDILTLATAACGGVTKPSPLGSTTIVVYVQHTARRVKLTHDSGVQRQQEC